MSAPVRVVVTLSLVMLCAGSIGAQTWCPPAMPIVQEAGQTYRIVYKTVYEQEEITAYRIEYDTVYDQQQVTYQRPVWETQYREYRYQVARPVTETSYREETYTVSRPVWETGVREERYTVRKPVYETSYRTEQYTVMRPVSTSRTEYVDQGCFTQQMVFKPMLPKNSLTWQSGKCTVDPLTGQTVYKSPGLYWTQTPRGRYEVKKVWQPNMVARQVPVTTYMPTVETRQVPVQTCRYVEEQIVRKIPYKVCRMVNEQKVRRVPVTTCRTVYEERVTKVPYRVCKMVTEQKTVQVARRVERRVPVTYTCTKPRVICYRVPLDACGNPIVIEQGTAVETPAAANVPTPAQPRKSEDTADQQPGLGADEGDPKPLENGVTPTAPNPNDRAPAPAEEVVPSDDDTTV